MPRTLPLSDAQANLTEIVAGMTPGEELVLTADGQPVAVVTRPPRAKWPCQPGTAAERKPRQPGSAKGVLVILQEDDEHLKDFAEYME
jgi:antitoxin (DNA-binding transcriptional repressor) of toxin-antitoxin stability system